MQGLLDFDWLGAGPVVSPIGLQQGVGKMGNNGTPPYSICRGELWVDLAGFFFTLPGQNCHVTPLPSQLCNCSTLQQIQDILLQTVHSIIMYRIY
jgi:hypothetical protein